MRFCFDIDGVIFKINKDYKKHEPIWSTVKYLHTLKDLNHEIILYTARKMKTFNGNIGKINKEIVEDTLFNLNVFNIPYDEIYFGKPNADVYIDDKALNFYDFKEYIMEPQTSNNLNNNNNNNNIGIITYRLNEIEKKIEKNLEALLSRMDTLIDKINKSELKVNELKVKVDNLERDVQVLKQTDDKTKEDLNQIKITMAEKIGWGALGGGTMTIIVKLFESLSGGQ